MSNQEEADAKTFFAAKFVSSRGSNILSIQTFALYYGLILSKPLYIKIGARKNESILKVTKAPPEKNLFEALPGFHAFLGCDSTTAFHGIA